jgi:hypothetical protein
MPLCLDHLRGQGVRRDTPFPGCFLARQDEAIGARPLKLDAHWWRERWARSVISWAETWAQILGKTRAVTARPKATRQLLGLLSSTPLPGSLENIG